MRLLRRAVGFYCWLRDVLGRLRGIRVSGGARIAHAESWRATSETKGRDGSMAWRWNGARNKVAAMRAAGRPDLSAQEGHTRSHQRAARRQRCRHRPDPQMYREPEGPIASDSRRRPVRAQSVYFKPVELSRAKPQTRQMDDARSKKAHRAGTEGGRRHSVVRRCVERSRGGPYRTGQRTSGSTECQREL